MNLGANLRWLRVNGPHGYMKLRDVARRVNVSPAQWSHWENNRERPDRDLLASRICPMLGGDLGELLRLWEDWTEAPPPDLSRSICSGRVSEGPTPVPDLIECWLCPAPTVRDTDYCAEHLGVTW